MTMLLDILRGLACYLLITPWMLGVLWLILPGERGRAFVALAGSGFLILLLVIVVLTQIKIVAPSGASMAIKPGQPGEVLRTRPDGSYHWVHLDDSR